MGAGIVGETSHTGETEFRRQVRSQTESENEGNFGNMSHVTGHTSLSSLYFFTAIATEYCVSSHISFNTPSAIVFSTEIRN